MGNINNIKFSIIIPVYNSGATIGRAIECIQNQEYTNWELILVDDGSTDNTIGAINEYLNEERIQYFHQKNSGAGAARNQGAMKATGDYLIFCDSDDEFSSKMLSAYCEIIQGDDVGIAFAGYFNSEANKVVPPKKKGRYFSGKRVSCLASTWAVKKSLFEKAGGYEDSLKQSQNWELMLRLVWYCEKLNLRTVETKFPVFTYHNIFSQKKVEKLKAIRFYSYKIIYKKHKKLKLFSNKIISGFAQTAAYNAFLLKNYKGSISWQLKSIKTYPYNFRSYLRLFRYLTRVK